MLTRLVTEPRRIVWENGETGETGEMGTAGTDGTTGTRCENGTGYGVRGQGNSRFSILHSRLETTKQAKGAKQAKGEQPLMKNWREQEENERRKRGKERSSQRFRKQGLNLAAFDEGEPESVPKKARSK